MIFLFAHAGESHSNTTENVVHTVKADWPKIVLVTAVFVFIMLAIVYAATSKTKNSSKKDTSAEAKTEE